MSILFPALGNPINVLKCRLGGGTWMQGFDYMCLVFYDDGDKECRSNAECKGLCLQDKKGDFVGKCSSSNLYEGEYCYFSSISNVTCTDTEDVLNPDNR